MDEVGKLFQEEEYFVPELMLAGRAMKAAMEPLRPLLAASGAKPVGTVVAGAVKGDLHDIGKNLVISMLEGAGFKVIDLGSDVTPQKFVEAIREHKPEIVCLSALLTVTMTSMKSTIEAIREAGLRQDVKILVGGAPLSEKYAMEIGADGYGVVGDGRGGAGAPAGGAVELTCARPSRRVFSRSSRSATRTTSSSALRRTRCAAASASRSARARSTRKSISPCRRWS